MTGRITAWAIDFARAMRERPWWVRILFRFVVGRYAYREFIGLQDALTMDETSPYFSYGLEDMDYHSDHVPLDFGVERSSRPLKSGQSYILD